MRADGVERERNPMGGDALGPCLAPAAPPTPMSVRGGAPWRADPAVSASFAAARAAAPDDVHRRHHARAAVGIQEVHRATNEQMRSRRGRGRSRQPPGVRIVRSAVVIGAIGVVAAFAALVAGGVRDGLGADDLPTFTSAPPEFGSVVLEMSDRDASGTLSTGTMITDPTARHVQYRGVVAGEAIEVRRTPSGTFVHEFGEWVEIDEASDLTAVLDSAALTPAFEYHVPDEMRPFVNVRDRGEHTVDGRDLLFLDLIVHRRF